MYEVHGWFGLADSTDESDPQVEHEQVRNLQRLLEEARHPDFYARVAPMNGQYFLVLQGFANRPRADAGWVEEVVSFVRTRLPGSWGLLYERDDETTLPPGPNAYRVRVLARGHIHERADPFLSPCRPTIED